MVRSLEITCGGVFRDRLGTFLGAFTCNLGISSVFTAEIHGSILALEYAAHNWWKNLWLESVQVISSHIFREGNCCADKLANMGHSIQGTVWLSVSPPELHADFYKDHCDVPRYRFP
ncbi:hypothetical protein MTR_3g026170 [Medicago truncatula]|uniref:Uncharacterized protein n=1 Tax=Medicago truncatula TaxID=3880 RepID=A0A072UUV0_MEDTR|nr:hypothetical protein MTR_3g026170 [Medicago truncatula]